MTLNPPEALQFSPLAQRQQIEFRDGSQLVLHPLFDNGTPLPYHRAIHLPGKAPMVVDLRHAARQLGEDICVAQERDIPGLVRYTLRHSAPSAQTVLQRLLSNSKRLRSGRATS